MASAAPPKAASSDQKDVKKMVALFAVSAILGVLLLAFSVALGLIVLVIAEVFFAIAYRRFSKRPKPAS
jgi:uncharacterized protein YybS (DUF2232 family)